eukprot:Partr_v1_DN26905_c0_g1_i1_m7368
MLITTLAIAGFIIALAAASLSTSEKEIIVAAMTIEEQRAIISTLPAVPGGDDALNFVDRICMWPSSVDDDFLILLYRFKVENLLQRGGFGSVYKAIDGCTTKEDEGVYAVKVYDPNLKGYKGTNVHLGTLEWELEMMLRVSGRSGHVIPPFIYSFTLDRYGYAFMPLMRGTLEDVQFTSVGQIREFARQLIDAVQAVHHSETAHRDIKPRNILIESQYPLRIRLADFGLACKTDAPVPTEDFLDAPIVGTRGYIAFEILFQMTTGCTNSADIFSIGLILMDLILGDTMDATKSHILAAIRRRKRKHNIKWKRFFRLVEKERVMIAGRGTMSNDMEFAVLMLMRENAADAGVSYDNVKEASRQLDYKYQLQNHCEMESLVSLENGRICHHLISFIAECLNLNFDSRLSIDEAARHPLLRENP